VITLVTYVLAAFNSFEKKALHYVAVKSREALTRNLIKAIDLGASVISIRVLLIVKGENKILDEIIETNKQATDRAQQKIEEWERS
jgi:hypothetical protein